MMRDRLCGPSQDVPVGGRVSLLHRSIESIILLPLSLEGLIPTMKNRL